MKRIGLMSDTHGYLDPRVFEFFADCDEIWHAGDIGALTLAEALAAAKPLRAVWGNIDGPELRHRFPEVLRFTCEGVDVWLEHITGYPGRYARGLLTRLKANPPQLLIGGHSHILKVQRDPRLGLLFMNPGACGRHGFHQVRTLLRFELEGKVQNLQIVELGPRV